MAKQLTVFVENRPGRVEKVAEELFKAKVNIRALTIQDRGEFGLMKLLIDDPQKAYLTLAEKGFACALKDVLAVLINDRPGGLYELTKVFSKENINILDATAFVIESKKQAVFCVEVDDYAAHKGTVEKQGFAVLDDKQLYEL